MTFPTAGIANIVFRPLGDIFLLATVVAFAIILLVLVVWAIRVLNKIEQRRQIQIENERRIVDQIRAVVRCGNAIRRNLDRSC